MKAGNVDREGRGMTTRGPSKWVVGAAMAMGLGGLMGCEEGPSEEERSQREIGVAVIEVAEEVERPWRGPRPAFFDGWPGADEGMRSFELVWLGGEEELPLRVESIPDAPVVTVATYEDGEEVDWVQTRLVVVEPRLVAFVEDWQMWALEYDEEKGEVEGEEIEAEFEAGDKTEIYSGAGGECYLSHEEKIVLAECPPDDYVEAVSARGEALDEEVVMDGRRIEWWIKATWRDERGWFEVEEAPVEIHERRMEGYDMRDDSPPFERDPFR